MLIGAEVRGGAGKTWAARVRVFGIVAVFGGLLSGCSSWYDGTPKPPQMIQPTEAGDGAAPAKGLSADEGKRTYADGSRSDVTVVRPLRTEPPPPPKVNQAPAAPQSAPPPKVAQAPAAPTAARGSDGALPPRVETVPAGQAQARAGATATAADLPGAAPLLPGSAPAKASAGTPSEDAMQSLDAFVPTAYGVSYLAASIPFGHGSTHLSASDLATLKAVAREFKKAGGAVTVVGHASSRTGDMSALDHKIANFDVSVRRAEAVARALRKAGVPARAIFVGAVSDNEPVYREVMPEGEAYNRRTEVFLNQ